MSLLDMLKSPAIDIAAHGVELRQAYNFLDAIAIDPQDTCFCFQVFPDCPDCTVRPFHITGTLHDHAQRLIDANMHGGGVFVTVNKTDGKGRKAANITAVRALFVDLDGSPLEPVRHWEPRANLIINSSSGRFHAYWILKNIPPESFRNLQKTLAARFNGDPQVCDLSRCMRLPGFFHNKHDPYIVEIIEIGGMF